MAITVISASRVTDGAVSFVVRGLDAGYELDDRRCYVSVKKYGDPDIWYEVYPDNAGKIKISAGDTAFVTGIITGIRLSDTEITAFEKNTKYIFSIDISYTEDGKTKYSENTVEYTFGDTVPDIDGSTEETLYAPIIKSFNAYQTSDGEKSITVEYTAENMTSPSACGDDYSTMVAVSVGGKKKYIFYDEVSVKDKKTYSVDDYGTYEVFIEAINENSSGEATTKSGIITVKVEEFSGIFSLGCEWLTDKVLTSDNFAPLADTNTELVCARYPYITAENFNKFCVGINYLRSKSNLPEYGSFAEAKTGEQMTAEAFSHLYYAVKAVYDNENSGLEWSESFPQSAPASNKEITEEFVSGIDNAVWKLKEYISNNN